MPRIDQPEVGIPYLLGEMQHRDQSKVTAWLNLTDVAGRFTITIDNASVRLVARVRIFPSTEFLAPPGTTVVPISGALRWQTSAANLSIESA